MILSSSERREAVDVWKSLICLELLSFKLLNSFELASLSSFALVLARLVASIILALSVLIMSSSERREAVVVWRSLICLELFSFKLLNSFALASFSSFALVLA